MIEKVIVARGSSPYMAMSMQTSEKLFGKLRKAYLNLVSSGEIPEFKSQN